MAAAPTPVPAPDPKVIAARRLRLLKAQQQVRILYALAGIGGFVAALTT